MSPSPDIVPNVDHSVASQVLAINGGKMDGWDQIKGCRASDSFGCLTYYAPNQIPNLTRLATNFAVSDSTFSMADSPSWGGHLYAVAATTDDFAGDNPLPNRTVAPGPGWGCDSNKDSGWINPNTHTTTQQPSCIPDRTLGLPNGGAYRPTPARYVPTIMDRLAAAGLSWRFYAATNTQSLGYIWAVCPSFAECLDSSQKQQLVPTANILADAKNGQLPNFSLVLPPGSQATSQHNLYSMATGDNWIGRVVSAIEHGPDWNSTAIFITYDDCGCFYDHVAPGANADGTPQGPRVPVVIVSPYARHGYTDSTPTTFAGILAYDEFVFGMAPLGVNDAAAYPFSNAFNYGQTPLSDVSMVQSPVPAGEVIPHLADAT
jgi:phospholipase C